MILVFLTEFPTSELELDAVANLFDKNNDGMINYKDFLNALRTDVEKEVWKISF